MEEALSTIIEEVKSDNQNALEHLDAALEKIRAGKASPNMLDDVMVVYYGQPTPLKQVANVNTLDGRTLSIQPFEKTIIDDIGKGITNANLGLNPQNNGENIIINIPTLTEERRKELVKKVKSEGENAKVSIRNHRKDGNDMIKELQNEGVSEDECKAGTDEIQKTTDNYIKKVDEYIDYKQKDIMTV